MSAIPKLVADVCQNIGIDPDGAMWNCHGTWVMYHKALEQVAAKLGVKFDPPQIIEHDAEKRICVMCVTGHWQERSEWTIGEAMPINIDRGNNKQQYPFAMAEKRAKDRVILKLIGLHGHVYSQDEFADPETDLNKNKPSTPPPTHESAPAHVTPTPTREDAPATPDGPANDMPTVDEPPFDDLDYWTQWANSEVKTFPHKTRQQLFGWFEGNKKKLAIIKGKEFFDLLTTIQTEWDKFYEEKNDV